MKKKIESLSDLQIRKKKLKMEMELSKREFSHSLGTSRATLNQFLLHNVAIPAGIAGLGVAGVSKLMNSNDHDHEMVVKESHGLMKTVLPILASMVQTFILKNKIDEN